MWFYQALPMFQALCKELYIYSILTLPTAMWHHVKGTLLHLSLEKRKKNGIRQYLSMSKWLK